MTPQLQQAIKLLQLSNIELAEYCEAELEKNPLLERDESAPRDGERETAEREGASERADESLAREDFSKVSEMDQAAHDNMYDEAPPPSSPPSQAATLTD
jgi:RNA polymerase sigma-54 factor